MSTPSVRLRSLAVVLATLFSCAVSAAAEGTSSLDFTRRQWHRQDGLVSEEITQILQDRNGYLWVATTNGLLRFDGTQFQTIPLPTTPGLRGTTYVRAMAESDDLGLLVAPDSGGLWIIHPTQEPRPVPFNAALDGKTVLALYTEENGVVWAARSDEVVVRYSDGITQSLSIPSRLTGVRRIALAGDGRNRTWITSGSDLFRYRDGKLERQKVDFNDAELRVVSSRSESPWIVTADHLYKWSDAGPEPVVELTTFVGAHFVQAALEDASGALWLGTRSRGLQRVVDRQLTHIRDSHDDIYSLASDRDGNIWVGSNGAGLDRLRPKTYRIYDKSIGLLLDFSTTVCEDQNGAMWFANRDGGVVRLYKGETKMHPELPGWPSYSAVSVFPLRGGGVGFSCGPGLYQVGAPGNEAIRRIESVPVLPIVLATFVASNGDTWMSAGATEIGRLRGSIFRKYGVADGFPADEVRVITEDPSGRILVGTVGGKLLRFDGVRFTVIPLGVQTHTVAIQAILAEPDGTVWLGTEGNGVLALIEDQVQTINTSHGLPHGEISQILADNLGHLWFGSRGGIFRLSRNELLECARGRISTTHPILIGKDDGLGELSCLGLFQPGAWRSRDGNLWFATRRGVLEIDPAVQVAAPEPPPVEITRVRHDGRALPVAQATRMSSAVRRLEIDFSVLCLSTPQRVQAKYQLVGFDADWVNAVNNQVATYPRLPPGSYTFQVIAGVGDGAVNDVGDTLTFKVVPQWWQTLWFRLGLALALLVTVAVIVRAWSHRRLRRRLEKLERESAVVRERIRIAQNIHDDLGASLTRISLLTQSAQDTAGGPQFEQIYDTVSEVTRSMDEIVWAVNPKYDDLDGLSYYLGNFAQKFLNTAGIRCRLDMPDRLPAAALTSQMRHHLFLCCKEVLNNVVKHAAATSVSIRLTCSPDWLTITIHDDGRGLESADVAKKAKGARSGNGLPNIQARMTEVGGTAEFVTDPSGGTRVTLRTSLSSSSARQVP